MIHPDPAMIWYAGILQAARRRRCKARDMASVAHTDSMHPTAEHHLQVHLGPARLPGICYDRQAGPAPGIRHTGLSQFLSPSAIHRALRQASAREYETEDVWALDVGVGIGRAAPIGARLGVHLHFCAVFARPHHASSPSFACTCIVSAQLSVAQCHKDEIARCPDDVLHMTVNTLLEVVGRDRSTNWRKKYRSSSPPFR